VLTASRPATSLPSGAAATSTAAAGLSAPSWASSSALGATTYPVMSSAPATQIFSAPYSASLALASGPYPGPAQTADGRPSRRASVSSSRVTFLTSPSTCSTRTRISDISVKPPFSDELLGREELGDLGTAVALVLDDRAGGARRRRGEVDDLR